LTKTRKKLEFIAQAADPTARKIRPLDALAGAPEKFIHLSREHASRLGALRN
jgi:hypothetical protein